MIAALAAIAFAQTLEITPSDDVWVYPHASDNKDAYLRVWGTQGLAVANDPAEAEAFGYSYLKFDLAKLPANAKVTGAVLVLFSTPDPAWSAADSKAAPLEVRPLKGSFEEKTWDYGMIKNVSPLVGKDGVLGSSFPAKLEAGKPAKFEIDLLKGTAKLDKYLSGGKTFEVALTSQLDPSAIGNRATYKFYSKDYEKSEFRPKLILSYD